MNPRQVQIPQRCLNKVPLVPLSWNLINANSYLVCCLIFSEIMIEMLLECCLLHLSKLHFENFTMLHARWFFFYFLFQIVNPFLTNVPFFTPRKQWLTRGFPLFSKGKEREHWPEMGFNIWVVWLLCSLGFFFSSWKIWFEWDKWFHHLRASFIPVPIGKCDW